MGLSTAQKKPKIERDRFTEDGVRLFNHTKEHGVIYCDGYMEGKYVQEYDGEVVMYRGDLAPVGYTKGVPMPKKADELLSENEALQARIKDLESAQARTNELLARLSAQLEASAKGEPSVGGVPLTPVKPAATPKAEAPASGANRPK